MKRLNILRFFQSSASGESTDQVPVVPYATNERVIVNEETNENASNYERPNTRAHGKRSNEIAHSELPRRNSDKTVRKSSNLGSDRASSSHQTGNELDLPRQSPAPVRKSSNLGSDRASRQSPAPGRQKAQLTSIQLAHHALDEPLHTAELERQYNAAFPEEPVTKKRKSKLKTSKLNASASGISMQEPVQKKKKSAQPLPSLQNPAPVSELAQSTDSADMLDQIISSPTNLPASPSAPTTHQHRLASNSASATPSKQRTDGSVIASTAQSSSAPAKIGKGSKKGSNQPASNPTLSSPTQRSLVNNQPPIVVDPNQANLVEKFLKFEDKLNILKAFLKHGSLDVVRTKFYNEHQEAHFAELDDSKMKTMVKNLKAYLFQGGDLTKPLPFVAKAYKKTSKRIKNLVDPRRPSDDWEEQEQFRRDHWVEMQQIYCRIKNKQNIDRSAKQVKAQEEKEKTRAARSERSAARRQQANILQRRVEMQTEETIRRGAVWDSIVHYNLHCYRQDLIMLELEYAYAISRNVKGPIMERLAWIIEETKEEYLEFQDRLSKMQDRLDAYQQQAVEASKAAEMAEALSSSESSESCDSENE